MSTLEWTADDARAVELARVLAADAVERAGNGHPGTAISLASVLHLLYHKVLRFDPDDPGWIGRDRFILSAGHSSIAQYIQLYLSGSGLELTDLQQFRQFGSRTPGHPEFGQTPGVECTTGPLGMGVANGVGFAMAARRARSLYDPAAVERSIFDRRIYVVAGDGCLQEGMVAEACSLAGTQELGNLIVLYDDNRITIEGDARIAFTENVDQRFEAYGWQVQQVDFTNGGTTYEEKLDDLFAALTAAQADTSRPSLIHLSTVIGWPLPTKAGHHSVHGAKLGADEVAGLKTVLGFDPAVDFPVETDLVERLRATVRQRVAPLRAQWETDFAAWQIAAPDRYALLERVQAQGLPDLTTVLPQFTAEAGEVATRTASGAVLTALAETLPELWGGSADLGSSNNTTMVGQPSFLPANRATADWPADGDGRVIHFGVREQAMSAILNAIALDGLTRAFGGTFLVFSDYMRPAVRVAALSRIPSIFVWTHDSVAVGEDGPTHQPIEQIASLRLIPGLDVIRPADANEVVACWTKVLSRQQGPVGMILSRQNLPVFDRSPDSGLAAADQAARGAYTLLEASTGQPVIVLIATGSEVALALGARTELETAGYPTRVVSAPCLEWLAEQEPDYRDQLLPKNVVRVSIEAGVTYGWAGIIPGGQHVGINHFGASGPTNRLLQEYGLTVQQVVQAAQVGLAERGK
ncbi:MAG: transketolase [Propionibacteriaceae bacterium]|nr:transketolase [Propionibacteriaceae bacterium]